MMSPSPNDAYSEDGSQVMWGDGERSSRRGWRADDSGNQRAMLIVLPAADHPPAQASITSGTNRN